MPTDTDPIFTPTEGSGAQRYVYASPPDTGGYRIGVESWPDHVSLGVGCGGLRATLELSPVVARVLAAELIASADACDEFQRDPAA